MPIARYCICLSPAIEHPKDINEAPKIPETLKIHKLCCILNKGENPRFNFLSRKIYHVKSECEHLLKSPVDDNQCPQCEIKYGAEETQDWLRCNQCNQWFHENCF